MKINEQILPNAKWKLKCPNTMKPQYITVHNTANDASAANEIKYMRGNTLSTSYHYAVDDKEVIQAVLDTRNAWHCGDGNGKGNMTSIGVEICYSKSGGQRYKDAEENAVKLVAYLLKKHKLPINAVKQHNFWSGKDCPHRIRKEGRWSEFIKRVEKEMQRTAKETNKERCKLVVKFTHSSKNLPLFNQLLKDLKLTAERTSGTSTEVVEIAFAPNSVKYSKVVEWLEDKKISY